MKWWTIKARWCGLKHIGGPNGPPSFAQNHLLRHLCSRISMCVCHAVDGRHPSNMENHPWLLGFRSIESIYSIHLSTGAGFFPSQWPCGYIPLTKKLEAIGHLLCEHGHILWIHHCQDMKPTTLCSLKLTHKPALWVKDAGTCWIVGRDWYASTYIYIYTCGIHGWWLRLRSCTVFLAWKWTELIPWPCNKHATDWGFDFFRAWSNKKHVWKRRRWRRWHGTFNAIGASSCFKGRSSFLQETCHLKVLHL